MASWKLCHWYERESVALEKSLVSTFLFLKNSSFPFFTLFVPFVLLFLFSSIFFPIWFNFSSCHHSVLPSFLSRSLGLKQFVFLDFLYLIPPCPYSCYLSGPLPFFFTLCPPCPLCYNSSYTPLFIFVVPFASLSSLSILYLCTFCTVFISYPLYLSILS